MQSLEVDALAAVEHAQHLHRVAGLHPAGVLGQALEALFDVAALDAVERAVEPVAEVLVHGAAVDRERAVLASRAGGEIVLERLAQGGDRAVAGGPARGVLAGGDAPERLVGEAARLLRGYPSVASDDQTAVGGPAPTAAGAVVDDVGAHARGLDADAETGEPVVPADEGLVLRREGFDIALVESHLAQRGAHARANQFFFIAVPVLVMPSLRVS